ncbi:hypothetical protein BCR44DRAFT_1277865 [Catenaria anguillulae PL171]|uniref:Uncharacterized protein n=1 Tax=Catenaria anguillulae PL171 TaxID=765915 RepID=A0A1Y2H948_9FUNG|nr:hypothetical protein BCR44DRAFT_1277865 [Catenaria anguillulae PL171]
MPMDQYPTEREGSTADSTSSQEYGMSTHSQHAAIAHTREPSIVIYQEAFAQACQPSRDPSILPTNSHAFYPLPSHQLHPQPHNHNHHGYYQNHPPYPHIVPRQAVSPPPSPTTAPAPVSTSINLMHPALHRTPASRSPYHQHQ